MAQNKVSVFNLALAAVGARAALSSPDDASREAEQCRLWYEPVRQHVFRAAHWPALKAYRRLSLIKERDTSAAWVSTDPEPGWLYVYSTPVKMVAPRHLSNFRRFSTGTYTSTNQRVLYTDVEDAILFYTEDRDDPSIWDDDLYMAVAHALAAHICLPLTGKISRTRDVLAIANDKITQARVTSANEQEQMMETLPEWITQRGYTGAPGFTRYVQPYGSMIQMPGASVE